MAYCSATGIFFLVLPQLPDTVTVTNIINRHIARADGLINSKISKRYTVPITTTPPLLASLSEDITVYYTYRSFYSQDNLNRSEYLEELKNEAASILDEIRDGKIDLVDINGSVIEENSSEATTGILDSTTKDYQPFFDIDDSLNWAFDSDRLDDIKDNR
jgi:phage gp36-like protein